MEQDWEALAKRARDGDVEAFADLVDQFKRPLCAAIHPIVRDWHVTQDVAQDVFAAAFQRLPELRETRRFRAWLYRIARNRAVSRLRKNLSLRPKSLSHVDEEAIVGLKRGTECLDPFSERESRPSSAALARVRRVVLALPNDYGFLLTARYVEGLTVEEIAEVLDRTPKAVKAALYRARVLARESLGRAGLNLERILHEL